MTAHTPSPILRVLLLVAGVAASLIALPVEALGLGEAQLRSYLGQPLRVRVPVIADSIDDVGCVIVNAHSDDSPVPRNVRADVLTQGDRLALELRSQSAINELAITVKLTAGCSNMVTREYVLFLDPPPTIVLPEPAAASAASPAAVRSSASASGGGQPVDGRAATGDAAGPSAAPKPRPAKRRPPPNPTASAVPSRELTAAIAPPAAAVPDAGSPAAQAHRRVMAAPPAPVAQPDRPKSDRLVLMHDVDEPGLSMAEQVAKPDASNTPDDEHMRQIQREQARLVAVLTNQDPELVPSEREAALQKQLAELSTNLSNLGRQVNDVSARNRALESSRVARPLIVTMAVVTVIALLIAAWMAWRFRALQRRMSDTPWWEQTKIAPVTSFPDYGDLGPDHGPASADGVEVVEVMPNTVPRPAPVGVTSEPGIAETNSGPNTVQPLAPETTSLTGAGVGRQSIPSLTQYRPPSVSLWPSAEPDSHERENAGPTETYIPFGLVSVTGSMEEQVSAEAIPLKLDLELDLPALAIPATQPGGAKPAAGAPLQAELMPALDLELPMHPAAGATPAPDSETATRIEPDLGQRHDDVLATVPMAVVLSDPAEPATVQFRLIQFAAVLEQIDEMEKSQEPAKAIALLRQYVLRDESIPTLFWLLLFRFYKEINKKPVYEALGEHFARRYRRPMASWEEKLESRAPQLGLRDLPDIDARVRAHWGKREGIEIIRVLVCERDQADAVVFNEPLQRDLLQLAKIFPLDEQPV